MRIHYFCKRCEKKHKPTPHTIGPDGPLRAIDKREKQCCFCKRWAVMRGRSEVPSNCPAGHMPPGRIEEIAERAFAKSLDEAKADSPMLDMLGPDIEIIRTK